MKTAEFIDRVARGLEPRPRTGKKYVSSVLYDGETLYSYGLHYPLLFKLPCGPDQANANPGGRAWYWICNDRGYSNTTAKHISYARQHADFCVHLPRESGFFGGPATAPAAIIEAARTEIAENKNLIAEALERQIKRPRYEATYQRSIDRAEERIAHLQNLIIAAEAAQLYA